MSGRKILDGRVHSSRISGSQPKAATLAYRSSDPVAANIPILIAAPHAGRNYPEEISAQLRHGDTTKLRLEDRYVDLIAMEVASLTGAAFLVADAPRAMIDLNRSPDDIDWSMIHGPKPPNVRNLGANRRARTGLGLVPRRLPGLGEIWAATLDLKTLNARIAQIHRPYHDALAYALETLRDRFGGAMLVDLHSMPPLPRSYENAPHVEFVIGDRFGASCDMRLSQRVMSHLEVQGRGAARNRPYAGGYILDRHARPRRSIHGLQLEVCRSIYLDRGMNNPTGRIFSVCRLISNIVMVLADEMLDSSKIVRRDAAE